MSPISRMHFADRVSGVLFGQAIGDALGLGTEFMARGAVVRSYPSGLQRISQILRDAHRERWAPGSWTDDTDQMLCILDSLLERRVVDVLDIASRFRAWMVAGGMGIGMTVEAVLCCPDFLRHPHRAAERVWAHGGCRSAANGGVMRTAVLGIWDFQSPERVARHAEQVCRITHFDPRCVASCVLVSATIAGMLRGETAQDAIAAATVQAERHFPGLAAWVASVAAQPLRELRLDEGLSPGETNRIGYTLTTLAAAVWAFCNATSYEEGILSIVHEGGDAETNAAVAGAMLGAKFGRSSIPQRWLGELAGAKALGERAEVLLDEISPGDAKSA